MPTCAGSDPLAGLRRVLCRRTKSPSAQWCSFRRRPTSSDRQLIRTACCPIIDITVHNKYPQGMVRPRKFDRDEALDRATRAFWAKGYASTSTEDLLAAMKIGRQSLHNPFCDKRKLSLEALALYQRESTASHLERLNRSASPLGGI